MSKLSSEWRALLERRFVRGAKPVGLNIWQEAFCHWTAEQLGIDRHDSFERFNASWAALKGGHRGRQFKLFCELHHDLLRPFVDNRPEEIHRTYVTHSHLHFLRMLSYDIPQWPTHIPELMPVFENSSSSIVDFGCGLAQMSISLALFLREKGCSPELFLADIPVPQLEFLRWFCHQLKLSAIIAECTTSIPLPQLPACDLLVATELFEHLHDPLRYLAAFCEAVKPGGFLLTNIADHTSEFLHVTPDLASLRECLRKRGWRELRSNRVFQKP